MKRIEIIFLILFFLVFRIAFCQSIWDWKNPMPPEAYYWDVHFNNELTGWAVGFGMLIKTENSGQNWEVVNNYSKGMISRILFINDSIGWMTGKECYKTIDGGETWEYQYVSQLIQPYDILFFVSETTGWMGISRGTIYSTTNGGIDWLPIENSGSHSIFDLFFIDENNGWAISSYGLLHTTNGGHDWESQGAPSLPTNLYSLFFSDLSNGWLGSENGMVFNTSNGGLSWDTLQINTQKAIIDIKFISLNNGVAATNEDCFLTSDGGVTWQEFPLLVHSVRAIAYPNQDLIYTVGSHLQYSLDSGTNWTLVEHGFTDHIRSVFMIDEDIVYVVGDNGLIFTSNDRGDSWIGQNSNTTEHLQDVFFINDNYGWITGLNHTLLKTSDGGNNWLPVSVEVEGDFYSITFWGDQLGWFVTNNGKVLKTTNGGISWHSFPTVNYAALNCLYFVNEYVGWAVGDGGKIVKTLNGGLSWELQNSNLSNDLYSVCFVDELRGWATGWQVILHTENGGQSWQVQFEKDDKPWLTLHSIIFTDPFNGWACGTNGVALHTTDGGNQWTYQNAGYNVEINSENIDLNDVFFLNHNQGFLAGQDGSVFYTNHGTSTGPSIHVQPSDTNLCVGSLLSLSVIATGDSLRFQWLKNDKTIQGENTNPLVIDSIENSDGGKYTCRVYNNSSVVSSNPIIVNVVNPMEIILQPSDITASVNDYVVFNQAIIGSIPIAYQWQKNGLDIPNANFHTYAITSVQHSDTGMYRCVISNLCNEVVTDEAKLTVIPGSGIDEYKSDTILEVFPNPVSKLLQVKFFDPQKESSIVSLFDAHGIWILDEYIPAGSIKTSIDVESFIAGLYFIRIKQSNVNFFKKFIKY
ncbi:MAG: YCF48-related protein [Bacteroidales bacterium]